MIPSSHEPQDPGCVNGKRKYIVDIVGDLPVILMEINPDNPVNPVKKTYIYANGQIIAQHDGDHTTDRYFYQHDRLGSVRQVINRYGNVKNHYTYDPFGEVFATEVTENTENSFMFTGQYYDSETNEYYLRARQYSPHIGRFTGRDPVFGTFEESLTLHKYLYCTNDPVNKIDPWGLWTVHVGGTAFLSFGWSGVRQTSIVIDDDGNVGWMNVTGLGGGTPAASAGITAGWTNADTIFDLEGMGSATGASALIAGAEYVFGRQRSGKMYHGFDVTVGGTISPAYGIEVHTHVTKTKIYPSDINWREAKDAMQNFLFESALYETQTLGQSYLLLGMWGCLE